MPSGLRHPDWYLIAEQRFRRRAGVTQVVQRFRGERFLVLWDSLSGQSLRLSDRAAVMWQRLDGELTVDALWRLLSQDIATAPTQRELVDWVLQLVSSGLILSDHALDPAYLSDRAHRKRDKMLESRAANPLAIKVNLFDPEPLLRATYPYIRWIFHPIGGLAVLFLILSGIVAAVLNWQALLGSVDTSLLTQAGVIALFLSYPVMKALHELGHGWTVLHYGGEVREAGIMLLLFVPVPYVDASAATAFENPRARMLVGGAGVIVELAMASLSLLLWLQIEPGVEKAVLYSFVVMGSLSTLLFNGNPLLKFDAYYVLSDWLEMPNLATRAGNLLSDVFLTRVMGLRPETRTEPREAAILLLYAVLSLAYRLSLTLIIVLAVSSLFYALGVVLAVWAFAGGMILPLIRLAKRGWQMARGQNRTGRATGRFVAILVVVIGGGGLVPLPFSAQGQGQIVSTQAAELHIGSSGIMDATALADGAAVQAGAVLLSVRNSEQSARLAGSALRVSDLQERLSRGGLSVAERADLLASLVHARQALSDAQTREAERDLTAPLAGRLSWTGGRTPVPGTFVYRGDLLGHIIAPEAIQVEIAFPAAYAGLLPETGAPVVLRLPDGSTQTRQLQRFQVLDTGAEVPFALLAPNGGSVPAQPGQPNRALSPVLVAWIAPEGDLTRQSGMRVEARIDLPPKPLFSQMVFHLQRLFLRVTRV